MFAVAAVTDKLDGYVARRAATDHRRSASSSTRWPTSSSSRRRSSRWSAWKLPAWVAMVIIGREFAVSVLRIVGVAQGVSIPATAGKLKTTSQIVCIIILMWPHGHSTRSARVEVIAVAAMVALTLVSGVQYFLKARDNLHLPGTGK